MSVRESVGYAIVCDFPGCTVDTNEVGEYGAWGDLETAIDEWVHEGEGYAGDLGYYCRTHTVWVDAGGPAEGVEERAPMLPTVENLFVLAERRIADRIDYLTRGALFRHGERVRASAARWNQRHPLTDAEKARIILGPLANSRVALGPLAA